MSSPPPSTTTTTRNTDDADQAEHPSISRRSWPSILSPFSPSALALLPRLRRPARYLRADHVPETEPDSEGLQPTVQDYHSINLPPQVRVPKKVRTPVRVEGKVWFANERSKSEPRGENNSNSEAPSSLGILVEHFCDPRDTFSCSLQCI